MHYFIHFQCFLPKLRTLNLKHFDHFQSTNRSHSRDLGFLVRQDLHSQLDSNISLIMNFP